MEVLPWWVLPVSGMDTTKIVPFNGLSGTLLYRKVLESQRNFCARWESALDKTNRGGYNLIISVQRRNACKA